MFDIASQGPKIFFETILVHEVFGKTDYNAIILEGVTPL